MMAVKKSILSFFEEHQTVASVLTMVISFMAIGSWQTSDIRADIKETNKRIDALFQYVLIKEVK